MEAQTEGNTWDDGHALFDTLADSQAEVERETLGDTLSDAQELVDTLADSLA